jgi:hypothetical protein
LRTLESPAGRSWIVLRSPSADASVTLPARTHHRRALVLLALGIFQLWLWGTRIVNLLQEVGSFSAAFVAVHLVLYVAAIGAGLLLLGFGWAQLREAVGRRADRQDVVA